MTRAKKLRGDPCPSDVSLVRPRFFVFLDKKSGTRRFEVPADEHGRLPMDRAVSLLAIHCLARRQAPRDFSILVAVSDEVANGLMGRAAKLFRACSENAVSPMMLSHRQHEVLRCIAQNLSNKEIAGKLKVTVRTVKFHVSALLAKFDVRGRAALMLEAIGLLSSDTVRAREGNPPPFAARQGLAAAMSAGAGAAADPRLLLPLDRTSSR